ncbi:MAG: hypothetical protein E5Y12_14110 [Mesorhizobium sp.]|nr:MAG: hypothetical protein E5Y12_14110 [Mesorhizobium sp.]
MGISSVLAILKILLVRPRSRAGGGLEPPKWEIRGLYNRSLPVSQRFWMHSPETANRWLAERLGALEQRHRLALLAGSGLGAITPSRGNRLPKCHAEN